MRVLFVCAGNQFRSVISECVLKTAAAGLLGGRDGVIEVESSGLSAEPGFGEHPEALRVLELLGVPYCGSSSVSTDEEQVARCDLMVSMTRQQCYVSASRFPEYSRRCFSLLELNGAIETLLDGRAVMNDSALGEALGGTTPRELRRGLDRSVEAIVDTPRELLRPLAGVPMGVREMMTLFAPCFYQVSGIHDPLGGTAAEIEECARIVKREVELFLRGILTLALADSR